MWCAGWVSCFVKLRTGQLQTLPGLHVVMGVLTGTSFQFFPGGGQNFYRLPRGGEGQNMKENKLFAKTQKVTIFPIQGGANAPLPCPPK